MINPEDFDPVDKKRAALIMSRINTSPFSKLLGMRYEEIRKEYARMILPYRPELNQPAGIVHGGAIASLIDTVVVGAILSNIDDMKRQFVTVNMHIHYTGAAVEENMIATGYIRKSGRTIIFAAVEVYGEITKKQIAYGDLGYLIR